MLDHEVNKDVLIRNDFPAHDFLRKILESPYYINICKKRIVCYRTVFQKHARNENVSRLTTSAAIFNLATDRKSVV